MVRLFSKQKFLGFFFFSQICILLSRIENVRTNFGLNLATLCFKNTRLVCLFVSVCVCVSLESVLFCFCVLVGASNLSTRIHSFDGLTALRNLTLTACPFCLILLDYTLPRARTLPSSSSEKQNRKSHFSFSLRAGRCECAHDF